MQSSDETLTAPQLATPDEALWLKDASSSSGSDEALGSGPESLENLMAHADYHTVPDHTGIPPSEPSSAPPLPPEVPGHVPPEFSDNTPLVSAPEQIGRPELAKSLPQSETHGQTECSLSAAPSGKSKDSPVHKSGVSCEVLDCPWFWTFLILALLPWMLVFFDLASAFEIEEANLSTTWCNRKAKKPGHVNISDVNDTVTQEENWDYFDAMPTFGGRRLTLSQGPPGLETCQTVADWFLTGHWRKVKRLPVDALGSISRYHSCHTYYGVVDRSTKHCDDVVFLPDVCSTIGPCPWKIFTTSDARALLQGKWVAVIGDSATRIDFSNFVVLVRGAILSTDGTYGWPYWDGVDSNGTRCWEGHTSLPDGRHRCVIDEVFGVGHTAVRLTYDFVTRVDFWPTIFPELLSRHRKNASPDFRKKTAPDIIIFANGPWEFYTHHYLPKRDPEYFSAGGGYDAQLSGFLQQLRNELPDTLVLWQGQLSGLESTRRFIEKTNARQQSILPQFLGVFLNRSQMLQPAPPGFIGDTRYIDPELKGPNNGFHVSGPISDATVNVWLNVMKVLTAPPSPLLSPLSSYITTSASNASNSSNTNASNSSNTSTSSPLPLSSSNGTSASSADTSLASSSGTSLAASAKPSLDSAGRSGFVFAIVAFVMSCGRVVFLLSDRKTKQSTVSHRNEWSHAIDLKKGLLTILMIFWHVAQVSVQPKILHLALDTWFLDNLDHWANGICVHGFLLSYGFTSFTAYLSPQARSKRTQRQNAQACMYGVAKIILSSWILSAAYVLIHRPLSETGSVVIDVVTFQVVYLYSDILVAFPLVQLLGVPVSLAVDILLVRFNIKRWATLCISFSLVCGGLLTTTAITWDTCVGTWAPYKSGFFGCNCSRPHVPIFPAVPLLVYYISGMFIARCVSAEVSNIKPSQVLLFGSVLFWARLPLSAAWSFLWANLDASSSVGALTRFPPSPLWVVGNAHPVFVITGLCYAVARESLQRPWLYAVLRDIYWIGQNSLVYLILSSLVLYAISEPTLSVPESYLVSVLMLSGITVILTTVRLAPDRSRREYENTKTATAPMYTTKIGISVSSAA